MARTKKAKRGSSGSPHSSRRQRGFLDAFTEPDIDYWKNNSVDTLNYRHAIYFDLEKQRFAQHGDLVAALRDAGGSPQIINSWVRVTDYRWCLTPLSSAGICLEVQGTPPEGTSCIRLDRTNLCLPGTV